MESNLNISYVESNGNMFKTITFSMVLFLVN